MDKVVQIRKEIIKTLQAFGYEDVSFVEREKSYEISFPVNNGFETFLQRHKDAISMLAKGFLCSFYYTSDRKQVILHKKCRGLDPDDGRYSYLLHAMRIAENNKTKKGDVCGKEIFINMYDHFERVLLEKPVTELIGEVLGDNENMDKAIHTKGCRTISWKEGEFREITNEMAELHARKNADYGDSFGQTYRELGIISAVTRMSDKMNRLKMLVAHKDAQQVKDESIDDTLIDLACYAVMTLMERRREHE